MQTGAEFSSQCHSERSEESRPALMRTGAQGGVAVIYVKKKPERDSSLRSE